VKELAKYHERAVIKDFQGRW